jgi:hypothetical protein
LKITKGSARACPALPDIRVLIRIFAAFSRANEQRVSNNTKRVTVKN